MAEVRPGPTGADGLAREQAGTEASARPGRALGLDLGSRRIGVAVSDDGRRVASAFSVLPRSAAHSQDHAQVAELVASTGANVVVVGLPLSLTGAVGPAAQLVQDEVAELRQALEVPVEVCDERYSTVVAHRALSASGQRSKQRRAVVDKVAAEAILQTWLDAGRRRERGAPVAPTPASR